MAHLHYQSSARFTKKTVLNLWKWTDRGFSSISADIQCFIATLQRSHLRQFTQLPPARPLLCLVQRWKYSAGLCAVAAAALDISAAGWDTDPES